MASSRGVARADAFAGRDCEPDGSRVSRGIQASTLSVDEAAKRAVPVARENIGITRHARRIAVPTDAICVHTDTTATLTRVIAIRTRGNG